MGRIIFGAHGIDYERRRLISLYKTAERLVSHGNDKTYIIYILRYKIASKSNMLIIFGFVMLNLLTFYYKEGNKKAVP